MVKYMGLKIIVKEVTNFNYFITSYKNTLIIYWNKHLDSKEKSRILHNAIRNVKKIA